MDRQNLFPDTTKIENGSMTINGCDLTNLADQYGTPLYLYDRAMLDKTVKAYQAALAEFYPGESSFTYAGKVFLCLAITEWTQERSLLTAVVWLDHG